MSDITLMPFLKWAGGKRQVIKYIRKYVPHKFNTYYEPFVGAGAVFFDLLPENAVINDINSELINVYKVIKYSVEELILDLKKHVNSEEYFYSIRGLDRDKVIFNSLTDVEKASRTIYLNKTCYNGLYRVNKSGHFNTPFGRYKNPEIINEDLLREISEYLNNANVVILNCDFEEAIKNISPNDFVYFDPPYDPLSETSNFTSYSSLGFSKDDQIRLKEVCDNLNDKNIKFLLSNSSTDFILDLYSNYKIEFIQAKRFINSNVNKRGNIQEILVRNYD
ncbi:MAG TPA: DNA adenine methylase [Soehngenia sp.]|nr:DNA adenine methylase [Soehngenia sp.]